MAPLSETLLEVIRCPKSGQRLTLASPELVAKLNALRESGSLPLDAAVPQLDLGAPIEAALLCEDGVSCYAVQNGIPVLLPDHRITL